MQDEMNKDNNDMKQFSQPSFPAKEAWQNMQEILNKEMPVNEKRKKRLVFFWFVGLLLMGGGTFVSINNSIENKNNIAATTNNTINNSSNFSTQNKPEATQKNIRSTNIEDFNTSTKNDVAKAIKTLENANYSSIAPNTIDRRIENKYRSNKSDLTKTTSYLFTDAESYNDITKMKIVKGDFVAYNYSNNQANSTTSISNIATIVTNNNLDETNKNETANLSVKTTENKNETAVIKVPKPKFNKALQYGLQWNIALPQANNYLDYKAKNQPLTIAIPEFWVSKRISPKSEISLQLNPFAQYNLTSNNLLISNNYPVTVTQGSGQNQTTTNYVQSRSLVKAMGVELTAKYAYSINDKFSVAIGLGNNWLNAAVVNEKIKGNSDKIVRDSLYGIAKGFKDWNYLKSSFMVGRIEALYQLKNMQIGVAFLKPLGDLYTFENNNTNPINGRLVLRWKIK